MNTRNKPKGPSKMPKRYSGMPGWEYHPTKGFKRNLADPWAFMKKPSIDEIHPSYFHEHN